MREKLWTPTFGKKKCSSTERTSTIMITKRLSKCPLVEYEGNKTSQGSIIATKGDQRPDTQIQSEESPRLQQNIQQGIQSGINQFYLSLTVAMASVLTKYISYWIFILFFSYIYPPAFSMLIFVVTLENVVDVLVGADCCLVAGFQDYRFSCLNFEIPHEKVGKNWW